MFEHLLWPSSELSPWEHKQKVAVLAPALRGSQAWLSRETETKHVITNALMGEVQTARGMSSKGSQHEVGQDAQRAQSLHLLLISTLW